MSDPSTIAIEPVHAKASLKRFIKVPFGLYADDPCWVPPLIFERLEAFDMEKNPYFRHAQAQYWIATREGRDVGRISAQIDELWLERYGTATGHFGLIESVEDPEVLAALFRTAEAWLGERGMTEIAGPFNFSTNEECGLLVDGFETPPSLMMGHARRWYGPGIEALGFEKAKDLLAYRYEVTDSLPRGVRSLVAKLDDEPGLRFRALDMKAIDSEVALIVDIFNDSWSDNWGMVPFTEAEAGELAKTLRLLIIPDMVSIAELNGEAVGMFICLPNLNEAIRDLGGHLFPFGILKLVWRLKVRGVKTARVPLMGIRKAHQQTMIGSVLAFGLIDRVWRAGAARGFREGELSWILEDNMPIRRVIEGVGGQVYKTYRIYRKSLASSGTSGA